MTAIVTTHCVVFKIRRWEAAKAELMGSTWWPVSAGDLWGHSGLWHGSWPLRVTAEGNSSRPQLLKLHTQLCLENLSPGLLLLPLINSPHSHYCFHDGFEDTVSATHVMSIMLKMFLINAWLDIPAAYLPFGSATSPPALRLVWISNASCAKAFSLSWLHCRVSHLPQEESFNPIWEMRSPTTSSFASYFCHALTALYLAWG